MPTTSNQKSALHNCKGDMIEAAHWLGEAESHARAAYGESGTTQKIRELSVAAMKIRNELQAACKQL